MNVSVFVFARHSVFTWKRDTTVVLLDVTPLWCLWCHYGVIVVRFTLRLPDEVHGALEYEARLAHRSLHAEILNRLVESLEGTPERVLVQATTPEVPERDRLLASAGTLSPPAARSGCLYDTPVGTKCKSCGKVH